MANSSALIGFGAVIAVSLVLQQVRAFASKAVAPSSALKFFKVIGDLKTLKRTGWVKSNVELPESVADHMYRMSMLTLLIKDPSIDRERLMKICMVHDLAEAIVGDITPHDKSITKEMKRDMEEHALIKIAEDVGDSAIAAEIKSLWLEYENCSSPEARVAKNLDKFEMILQADEYERTQGKDLQDFFDSTEGKFDHPEVMSWDKLLRESRDMNKESK
jgi:putative hydrolases of HD superfamily